MTNTLREKYLQEAVEWEAQFVSCLEANDRIGAWEACEYTQMYANLARAAAAMAHQTALESIASEQAAFYDLQVRLAQYASR